VLEETVSGGVIAVSEGGREKYDHVIVAGVSDDLRLLEVSKY